MPEGLATYVFMLRVAVGLFFEMVFVALDAATHLPTFGATLILIGAVLTWAVWARFMQWLANWRITTRPDQPATWKMELLGSVLSLPVLPLFGVFLFFRWIWSKIRPKQDGQESPPKAVLSAAHGPSYLASAGIMAALVLVARVLEPILGAMLDLSDPSFAWSFLFLGWHPAAHAVMPLHGYPGLAVVMATLGWGSAWWVTARVIRVSSGTWENLYERRSEPDTLPGWRRWGGFLDLHEPVRSYLDWAKWIFLATLPLVLLSMASVGGEVYRLDASFLVVGTLLSLSMLLNLWLRGALVEVPAEAAPKPGVPQAVMKGWPDVLADLGTRLQAIEPPPLSIPTAIAPLPLKDGDPFKDGLLSPMLKEIVPAVGGKAARLTEVQEVALRELSQWAVAQAGRPIQSSESIGMGGMAPAAVLDHVASRVVVAPEGTGRTLLTRLAACNHVISHTRAVLVVLRDDATADRWRDGMNAMLLPSTLRWNVRVRRAGSEFLEDLALGILPDVLVCSVREMVTDVLVGGPSRDDFLRLVGLLVVDDVDSFIGPMEVHAHLAFQRLHVRLRELQGLRHTRHNASVPVLGVMGDTMHDPSTWLQALLGTEVALYQPPVDAEERIFQEAAQLAAKGDASADTKGAAEAPEKQALRARIDKALAGRHHLRFRIADMVGKTGRRIAVADVIASCERLSVPWHYRTCGDGVRHIGRSAVRLEREPRCHVDDIEQACVVFFEGEWSAVVREMRRVPRAGALFSRLRLPGGAVPPFDDIAHEAEPIALLSVADPDADMVFTESDITSSLAPRLSELPHPVVRPALGEVARAHLGADLVGRWIEVEDVVRIYGDEGANAMLRLSMRGMLHAETRRVLESGADVYQDTVLVHASADAVRDPSRTVGEDDEVDADRLPPPTQQIDTALVPAAVVRDRTSNRDLFLVDRASAPIRFYPGRRFQDARGRFVVQSVHVEDGSDAVIEVDPVLDDSVSSPRRRVRCAIELPRDVANIPGGRHGAQVAAIQRRGNVVEPRTPLSLGNVPLAVRIAPTRVRVEHLATMQLGPVFYEIRQRQLDGSLALTGRIGGVDANGAVSRRAGARPGFNADEGLLTEAVWIHPYAMNKDVVPLTVGAARLVAAAMRMVLPVYYRAGADLLGVALHVGAERPADDQNLAPNDGFVIYDLDALRNGAAQALRRDGIENLLRLSRLVIERVLYHDRLLARFDEWTTEDELLKPLRPETADAKETVEDAAQAEDGAEGSRKRRRGAARGAEDAADDTSAVAASVADRTERESRLRKEALKWMDSVLAPEGGVSSVNKVGEYEETHEEGEGDSFDEGRCWYAADKTVAHLVWTRHRWRGPNEEELALDCGFDRVTVANARTLTEDDTVLVSYMSILADHAADPLHKLADGSVHGMPRGAFSGECKLSDPALVQAQLGYFSLVFAVAANDWQSVAPLARALAAVARVPYDKRKGPGRTRIEVPKAITDARKRFNVVQQLSRFVQGIRYAVPDKLRGGLRPPVSTVIYRVGDCDSRSTLLALLLRAVGIDAGMFVSMKESHAVCAAAVPLPIEPTADANAIRAAVKAWADEMGVSMPLVWAAQPSNTPGAMARDAARSGGAGSEAPELLLYVPIESTAYTPVGEVSFAEPESWVFLPFSAVWKRVDRTVSADPTDTLGLATDDSERGGVLT